MVGILMSTDTPRTKGAIMIFWAIVGGLVAFALLQLFHFFALGGIASTVKTVEKRLSDTERQVTATIKHALGESEVLSRLLQRSGLAPIPAGAAVTLLPSTASAPLGSAELDDAISALRAKISGVLSASITPARINAFEERISDFEVRVACFGAQIDSIMRRIAIIEDALHNSEAVNVAQSAALERANATIGALGAQLGGAIDRLADHVTDHLGPPADAGQKPPADEPASIDVK